MDAIRSLSVSATVFLLFAGSTSLALAQSAGGSDGNDWLKQPAPSSGSGGASGTAGSGGGWSTPAPSGTGTGWDPFKNAPAAPSPSPAPSPSSSSGGTTSEGGYLTDKNGTSKVFNTRDAQGNITGGWIEHYDAQGKLISKEPFSNTSAPTPPANGPGDYEVGRVTDKNGTTKLIHTMDAQGNVVGGYTLQYDPQGKLIGKEPINGLGVMSPSTLPTQADLQGAWRGTFSGGGAAGSMAITVSGAIVHGTISGSVKGDGVSGSFSGTIDAQGTFGANMSGTVHWNKGVAFSGHLAGRFTKGSASGTWIGAGGLDKASGTWRATP